MTTLDTARAYGESEALIGRLIGADPSWTIVTKVPPLQLGESAEPLAANALNRALDASFDALRRSRVAAVLLHDPSDRLAANGAAWRALLARRDAGEVGSVGVSARNPVEALAALDEPSVEVIQVATSLFDSRLTRAGFFARAVAEKKQIYVRSAFLQGVAYLDPAALPGHLAPLFPVMVEVAKWGAARGLTVAQACLLYVRDVVGASVVVGTETEDQLDANLQTWALPAFDAAARTELTALVRDVATEVVDPSKWPPTPA